jgi:hypothetical protein
MDIAVPVVSLGGTYVPVNSSCAVISFAEEDREQSYKIKS